MLKWWDEFWERRWHRKEAAKERRRVAERKSMIREEVVARVYLDEAIAEIKKRYTALERIGESARHPKTICVNCELAKIAYAGSVIRDVLCAHITHERGIDHITGNVLWCDEEGEWKLNQHPFARDINNGDCEFYIPKKEAECQSKE